MQVGEAPRPVNRRYLSLVLHWPRRRLARGRPRLAGSDPPRVQTPQTPRCEENAKACPGLAAVARDRGVSLLGLLSCDQAARRGAGRAGTQVGYSRLAHKIMPISSKPEIG